MCISKGLPTTQIDIKSSLQGRLQQSWAHIGAWKVSIWVWRRVDLEFTSHGTLRARAPKRNNLTGPKDLKIPHTLHTHTDCIHISHTHPCKNCSPGKNFWKKLLPPNKTELPPAKHNWSVRPLTWVPQKLEVWVMSGLQNIGTTNKHHFFYIHESPTLEYTKAH